MSDTLHVRYREGDATIERLLVLNALCVSERSWRDGVPGPARIRLALKKKELPALWEHHRDALLALDGAESLPADPARIATPR